MKRMPLSMMVPAKGVSEGRVRVRTVHFGLWGRHCDNPSPPPPLRTVAALPRLVETEGCVVLGGMNSRGLECEASVTAFLEMDDGSSGH